MFDSNSLAQKQTPPVTSLNHKQAASGNKQQYDVMTSEMYIDGAPHLNHLDTYRLYKNLVEKAYDLAQSNSSGQLRILDLGAGEGSATKIFLELGASVTAVDISTGQLNGMRNKCIGYEQRLTIVEQDVVQFLLETKEHYDIVALISFLHHVPDYEALLREAIRVIRPGGVILTFQDPVRYYSYGFFNHLIARSMYFIWRLLQGDIIGGSARFIRRQAGLYKPDDVHDNHEYHIVRLGVDQGAIRDLFIDQHFTCDLSVYFSTQNAVFQRIGSYFGLKNTFGLVAQHRDPFLIKK